MVMIVLVRFVNAYRNLAESRDVDYQGTGSGIMNHGHTVLFVRNLHIWCNHTSCRENDLKKGSQCRLNHEDALKYRETLDMV